MSEARAILDAAMSDSTRYRMCGNGVVSNVAEYIARRIAEAASEMVAHMQSDNRSSARR
jgi:hypothetical protein